MKTSEVAKQRWSQLAAALICAVMGLAFAAGSVKLALDIVEYSSLDQEATGHVVSEKNNSDSCTSRVSYDIAGQDYETSYGSCPGVGSSVTMKYAAGSPSDATADGPTRTYVGNPLIITGLLVCTGLFWFFGFRFLRETPED